MKGAKPAMSNVVPMKGDGLTTPEPLDWMSGHGREVWAELTPILVRNRHWQPQFAYEWAEYCEAAGDFVRFTGDIAAFGSWRENGGGRNGIMEKDRRVWRQRAEAMATMQRQAVNADLKIPKSAEVKFPT